MKYFPKKMIGMAGVILVAILAVGCSQPTTPPVDGVSRSIASLSITIPTTMDKASNFADYGGEAEITNSGLNIQILGNIAIIMAETLLAVLANKPWKTPNTAISEDFMQSEVWTKQVRNISFLLLNNRPAETGILEAAL